MTDPITPPSQPDLTHLRELLTAATTKAPWGVHEQYTRDEHVVFGGPDAYAVGVVWSYADAELIAALHNAVPALLAELEQTRADLSQARDRVKALDAALATARVYGEDVARQLTEARAEVRTLENSDALAVVKAEAERDAWEKRYVEMMTQRDRAIGEHAAARRELAQVERERDSAKAYVERVCVSRDNALSERDAARKQADQLRTVATAAQAWVARIHDPVNLWGDDIDVALIDAVRSLATSAPQPKVAEPQLCPGCSHAVGQHSGPGSGRKRCWVVRCKCAFSGREAAAAANANARPAATPVVSVPTTAADTNGDSDADPAEARGEYVYDLTAPQHNLITPVAEASGGEQAAPTDNRRFYLRRKPSEWREVGKPEYVRAERSAGFHNTLGQPDEPATHSFSAAAVEGRTECTKPSAAEGEAIA